ncbi:uncharacterized protein [Triticum aestivum]|uniref:uncharacterized protein isoform X2 n=1 Tax=Triticum aestivum TaxID=4565 RepID=UPI001D011E04|nr:uncharacterized protein LOC123043811 isoform X2 [Triticum aestivum]
MPPLLQGAGEIGDEDKKQQAGRGGLEVLGGRRSPSWFVMEAAPPARGHRWCARCRFFFFMKPASFSRSCYLVRFFLCDLILLFLFLLQDRRGCSRSFSLSLFLSLYSCSRGLLAVPKQGSVALPQGPTAAPRHHRLLAVGQQQEIKSRASMRAPVQNQSMSETTFGRVSDFIAPFAMFPKMDEPRGTRTIQFNLFSCFCKSRYSVLCWIC